MSQAIECPNLSRVIEEFEAVFRNKGGSCRVSGGVCTVVEARSGATPDFLSRSDRLDTGTLYQSTTYPT